jgi:hypothetical protein
MMLYVCGQSCSHRISLLLQCVNSGQKMHAASTCPVPKILNASKMIMQTPSPVVWKEEPFPRGTREVIRQAETVPLEDFTLFLNQVLT